MPDHSPIPDDAYKMEQPVVPWWKARIEKLEAELTSLRARAEKAEAQLAALGKPVTPPEPQWPTECIHGNTIGPYSCPQCEEIGLGGKPCQHPFGTTTCGYGPHHDIHHKDWGHEYVASRQSNPSQPEEPK